MKKSKIKKLTLQKKAIANLENQVKGGFWSRPFIQLPNTDIPTINDSCFSLCPHLSICNDY
ncbi:MAG: hypothetical protein AAF611_02580 [Bacteroidota bacterium]